MSEADYKFVVTTDELQLDGIYRFQIDENDILICKTNDKYFALKNQCSHARQPMHDGQIRGQTIICPAHGSSFNLSDGKHLTPPAFRPLQCYALKVEGNRIEVLIDEDL